MRRIFLCSVTLVLVWVFLSSTLNGSPLSRAWAGEKQWSREVWAIQPWGEKRRITVTSPKPEKKYTVGFLLPHLKSPYPVTLAYGAAQEAKHLGIKLMIKAAKGYDDLAGQIAQFENFVQQGVDAILLLPISFEGNVASLLEAQKKGVPVVLQGTTCNTHEHNGLVSVDLFDVGVKGAELLIEKSGGKANVAILPGPSGASWSKHFNDGACHAFQKHPAIKVLATKWSDPDITLAQNITENLLQTFPELDYVLTQEILINGACNAIEAAKKKTKVIGTFLLESGLPYLKRGTLQAAMVEETVMLGRMGLGLTIRVLNREKGKPWIINPEQVVLTPDMVDRIDRSLYWAPRDWRVPPVVE